MFLSDECSIVPDSSKAAAQLTADGISNSFSLDAYRQLADFWFQIRSFLQFSAGVVHSTPIEPQQHQLMLALKGLPQGKRPTVTTLAGCLGLKHHSTVELINRLQARGAIVRVSSDQDRREVLIKLTPFGEELLQSLSIVHWQKLQSLAPGWVALLSTILNNSPESLNGGEPVRAPEESQREMAYSASAKSAASS